MGKIDEIKLSIESEDFAQRRTGRKGTSYYNGLAAGYREGYRKRASEGKESPDENGNCIKPDVTNSEAKYCPCGGLIKPTNITGDMQCESCDRNF